MSYLETKILDWIIRSMRLDDLLNDLGAADTQSQFREIVQQNRAAYDVKQPPETLRKKLIINEEMIKQFRLINAYQKPTPAPRVILYFPGGAYVLGPNQFHWTLVELLGKWTGADVALLDYPRAPEYTARETLEISYQAFQKLSDRYGGQNMVFLGDSAGGGLALGLINLLKRRGNPFPRRLVLFSPWLDTGMSHPEIACYEGRDLILNARGLVKCGKAYAGEFSLRDPRVSPKYGILENLPPLHLFAGGQEMLWPDIRDFAQAAREAGVDVELDCQPRMQHDYPLFSMVPAARAALKKAAAAVLMESQ